MRGKLGQRYTGEIVAPVGDAKHGMEEDRDPGSERKDRERQGGMWGTGHRIQPWRQQGSLYVCIRRSLSQMCFSKITLTGCGCGDSERRW